MSKRDLAVKYHAEGYNCAQAVLLAFADELGMKKEELSGIALCFGGGMATGSTCGALTGGLMALGLMQKAQTPPAADEKAIGRGKAKELTKAFEEMHNTVMCRDILASPEGKDKKLCSALVGAMAEKV
ncbi:MAG: C_GCAxxG_C_C family protein [Clostridia bacterium]|nr:C_GCAxxG_C_C family protein [Clostridia bacterium]